MFGNRRARCSVATRSPCVGSQRVSLRDAIADRDDVRRCNGGTSTSAVTANDSGCATLVAMAQAGTLPAQDGQLMPQGDEFELQGEATTNLEREQGTQGGQKREHADDGMTAAPKILCFLGFLEC